MCPVCNIQQTINCKVQIQAKLTTTGNLQELIHFMAQSSIDDQIQSNQTKSKSRPATSPENSCNAYDTEDEVEGKISTLAELTECDSYHSNLDLTDDEGDERGDDDSMLDKANQDIEMKNDSEDDEYDDGLLDDYIQIDEEWKQRVKEYHVYSCGTKLPFAEGKFRYVYHSYYCVKSQKDGKQVGQRAVVKKWKDSHIFNKSDWGYDIRVCQIAQKLIEKWNKYEKVTLKKPFKILKPKVVWRRKNYYSKKAKNLVALNECLLVEDYLPGRFLKWNSNSGWTSKEHSSMQAFCHWTYHYSNGKILFCDAQGIITKKEYILTDPCILSVHARYGAADCGLDYMINWFNHHKCNKHCQKHWIKAKGKLKQKIKTMKNTTWTWSTEKFQKQKERERKEMCICGAKLAGVAAQDAACEQSNENETESSSCVSCNHCDAKVEGLIVVFSCPNGKNDTHPNGYTMCYHCFKSRASWNVEEEV